MPGAHRKVPHDSIRQQWDPNWTQVFWGDNLTRQALSVPAEVREF